MWTVTILKIKVFVSGFLKIILLQKNSDGVLGWIKFLLQ